MSYSSNYPLISVIIPSFNQGDYIEETILSVIGQQYPNLEIIIIDGGSTDQTVQIIEKYSKHITYWHSRKDQGQADAINQGMKLSSGEILCWLNSDDMYLSGTLLDVGKRFIGRTNENLLLYGAAVTIKEEPNSLKSGSQIPSSFDNFTLTYRDPIVQPSTFWTRKLWESAGELNISYNYVLDWDWFIRASQIAEFERVSKFYSVYRYHPQHKTSNGGIERRKEIFEIVKNYSSSYWIELYDYVHKNNDKIKNVIQKMNKLRIFKILTKIRFKHQHLLIVMFLPGLRGKLKNIEDLHRVMS
ncbi:MAG: glycosyltransferase [Cyanobacteria bacterium]|jgi:glycosyltransferase involved in cell wall biosynthesis|nr:glycosyltransferase [Cyanobacteria bacterium GSL.Bin21]